MSTRNGQIKHKNIYQNDSLNFITKIDTEMHFNRFLKIQNPWY